MPIFAGNKLTSGLVACQNSLLDEETQTVIIFWILCRNLRITLNR